MKLPEGPISRKWMINWSYTMVRGQLDTADEMRLLDAIQAHQVAQPDDLAFRDEMQRLILWEMARAAGFQTWLREKDATTIADLTARIERLEAERGDT